MELLIVFGIIGTLATITAAVIKPVELLNSSRDVKRMTELGNINKAIALYLYNEGPTFGSSSKVYVSLPDNNENCSSYNLPTLNPPYSYVCKPESTYKNTNGTGWIPINFNSIPQGSPLSSLPVDPQNNNNNNSNAYFTYTPDPDNKTWELTAKLLSESKRDFALNSKDGGDDDNRYEIGSNLLASSYPPYLYNYPPNELVYNLGFNEQVYAQTGPSSGQVSIFNDATHVYGTDNLYWDNINNRLGIGTASPSQKLTVAGLIESTSGGFKFPDGTTQATAVGFVAISPITVLSGGTAYPNYTLIDLSSAVPSTAKAALVNYIGEGSCETKWVFLASKSTGEGEISLRHYSAGKFNDANYGAAIIPLSESQHMYYYWNSCGSVTIKVYGYMQ